MGDRRHPPGANPFANTTLWLGAAGTAVAAGWAARRVLLARLLGLPPATHRVSVTRGVRIPMADGVTLVADHYRPHSADPLPTILIRTPYRRGGLEGGFMIFAAQRFAERGYHVICQDTRGRFDSEGAFEPYVHEAADGQATLAWIAGRPWSDGQTAMWGASYLGYTQWAAAAGAAAAGDNGLKALVPIITEANIGGLPEHSFGLDTALRWIVLLDAMEADDLSWLERWRRTSLASAQDRVLRPAFDQLPLSRADRHMLDKEVAFFQKWLDHDRADDPYWQAVDYRPNVPHAPPAHFIGGWYDIFIDGLLADYRAQRAGGRNGGVPYLTIGPWSHLDPQSQMRLDDALAWFDAHLKGDRRRLRAQPVRLYVMGADEWRDFPDWPPPSLPTPWFLSGVGAVGNGRLQNTPAAPANAPDHYLYDPADPTPNLGGPLLSSRAGPVDNRPLEARPDVLTFTTPPLATAIEMIGVPELTLYVRSSAAVTDFFGRICDVHPAGASINITDGIFTLRPGRGIPQPDGTIRITFPLSATAYRFRPGHAIRLQISSGAHPRYVRSAGLDESFLTVERLVAADQTIYHDADHPSAVTLPIA